MSNPFTSPEIAELYAKYRTTYPVTIYERVFQFLDEGSDQKLRHLAIDVGCGSGQNTKVLANSFEKVLAVDASEAQVEEARTACLGLPNITLRVGSAEDLDGLADEGSVDLVTVATALHFFEVKPFFEACQRVLRKGGVFAAYGYESITLDNPEADQVAKEFFWETLWDYYDPRVRHHLFSNGYQDLFSTLATVFPVTERFKELRRYCFRVAPVSSPIKEEGGSRHLRYETIKDPKLYKWPKTKVKASWSQTEPAQKRSLQEFSGFAKSAASYQTYLKQNPSIDDPLKSVQAKLKSIYGLTSDDEKLIGMSMDYIGILGKKI